MKKLRPLILQTLLNHLFKVEWHGRQKNYSALKHDKRYQLAVYFYNQKMRQV